MMLITAKDPLLQTLSVQTVVEYLTATGWSRVEHPNARWLVFQGPRGDSEEAIEVILPRGDDYQDSAVRLSDAVNLLAQIERISPYDVIARIQKFDRDILRVRILDSGLYRDSLSLELASHQIASLKNLVAYSACSEKDPRPYFTKALKVGAEHVKHCQFGHTFRGSFGFTIESPLRPSLQTELPEVVPPPPFERKVMERIARGLLIVQDAVADGNLEKLVRGYASGFNANMCRAWLEISNEKTIEVECTVLWSPKQGPSEDVEGVKNIHLESRTYQYLELAADELERVEPEKFTARGKIISLRSLDPTEEARVPRTIVVSTRDKEGDQINVSVSLNREDYSAACDAHKSGRSISVRGILERVGTRRRLMEPYDFRVEGWW